MPAIASAKSQGQTANSGLPARIHARNLLHLGVKGDCLPSRAQKFQGQTANSELPARIRAKTLLDLGVKSESLPSQAQSLKVRQPTAGCLRAYMQETCCI